MKRLGSRQGVASNILLSIFMMTATAFTLFVVYLVLTPVQNSFFNFISGFMGANPKMISSGGVTAVNKIMSSSVTQWSILFTIAIVGTLATIYLAVYRDEPVENYQEY